MKSPLSKLSLRFALRVNRHATGKNILGGSRETAGLSQDVTGINRDVTGTDTSREGQSFEKRSDSVPIADNPDVWRVRFKKRGMSRVKRTLVRIRRASRKAMHYLAVLTGPKLSIEEKSIMLFTLHEWKPEDLDEHRSRKEKARLYRFHREQARILEPQLIDILTNLNFCDQVTKDNKRIIKKRVKVQRADVSPYAYVFHITHVPFGVKKTDMAQAWVSTEIASTIGKKVRHELDLFGLRYTVEVGSTLSIPNFASFSDFERMPRNQPPLAFYAGQTTNGAPVYRNLADAPHMIVAGQTGGGKSNLLNGIICGYLLRQQPAMVKFLLFDLKGGVEFDSFYGVPHLWQFADDRDGIIEYPEAILPALDAVLEECNRRLALLKKSKTKNIGEYNRGKHERNKLPYLIGIFDEYTTARKLAGEKVETKLSTIANLSRAAGIHFIIGTQYPKAEVLSTLISINFTWRIAFNMTTAASQSVLGNWDAAGLTPVGRAILQTSEGEVHIQTPRITTSTIRSIVEAAKSGEGMIRVATVDPEEVLEWALNNTGGKLDRDTVLNQFKERITFAALNDLLRSMENKQYEVNGTLYTVRPAYANVARRMELVDVSQPAPDANETPHTTITRDELVTEEE